MSATQYARAEAVIDDLTAAHGRGESISSMAATHGLRREAITTVLIEHGVGVSSPAREAVLAYVRENTGLSVDDLATRLDMSKSSVSRYLRGSDEQRLVVSRKQTDMARFSEEEMGNALLAACRELSAEERSKGLSRMKYMALKGENDPAASTYIRRYGSWSEACRRHGVAAAAARRDNYVQEWSNDDILDAINEFIDETGSTVFHAYAEWASVNGRPSGPLLIMRLHSWADARIAAIARRENAA